MICQLHRKNLDNVERAETLVKKKSLLSSGASIVPIPGLDFGVDLKLMRDIIEDVNKIYGLDHDQVNSLSDQVKERIMSAAAIQGSQFIGRKVSEALLKVVIKDVVNEQLPNKQNGSRLLGKLYLHPLAIIL